MLVSPAVTTQWHQCAVCVQGWRWSFYISGIPGVVLGLLILLTVREPPRRTLPASSQSTGGGQTIQDSTQMTACQKLACTLKPFMTFSVILLCLGGSIRNAGEARTGIHSSSFTKRLKKNSLLPNATTAHLGLHITQTEKSGVQASQECTYLAVKPQALCVPVASVC